MIVAIYPVPIFHLSLQLNSLIIIHLKSAVFVQQILRLKLQNDSIYAIFKLETQTPLSI
jgi:hypothetical protein